VGLLNRLFNRPLQTSPRAGPAQMGAGFTRKTVTDMIAGGGKAVNVMGHRLPVGLILRSLCWALAGMLCGTPTWADEGALFSFPQFSSRFESAFAQKDESALARLVRTHPEKVRSLVDTFLSNHSRAVVDSRTQDAEKAVAHAAAAAGLAESLLDDPFPKSQVGRHRSWRRGDHERKIEADTRFKAAMAAFDEGRYGDVILPGRAALEMFVRIGDVAGQGLALHFLGQASRRLADYAVALTLHRRALALGRQAPDRLLEGQALIDLGDVHERRKEFEQAREAYLEAAQLLQSPSFWTEAARARRQLGDVYVATGDYERAYGAYRLALECAEKAGDAAGIAEFNDYLGYCHRMLGDYPAAIGYHRAALASAAGIASPDARLRACARACNHLGLCTAKLAAADAVAGAPERAADKYGEAISHEEKALGMAVDAQDRWRQGYVLRALSSMHRERGVLLEGRAAVVELESALRRADEAFALGSAMQEMEWQGLALHDRGLTLALLGREQEGLAAFQEALDLWDQIGDLQSAGYAHRFVARRFHETAGRHAEAEADYDHALRAFERIGDVESQAFTTMDKARVASRQGRPEQAADLYEAAVARLEAVRAKAGFPEFRKAFMGKVYDRYEEAACFALSRGMNERALGYVERMKARTFLDQLAEGRVELHKGIDPALRDQRDKLEGELAAVTDEIAAQYRKSSPDEKALAAAKAHMARLEAALDRLKKQIRMQNPLYAAVEYPVPVTVGELQSGVLAADEILIEYFVAAREVYCFVITPQGFQVARLPVDAPQLRDKVAALVDNLNNGLARGEGYNRPSAGELYDILLKPFEKEMAGRTLVIVPDGILALFPFEAMVVRKEGRRSYLFEQHAVKYVQSATILALLRSGRSRQASGDGFVGFGDPVYDYASFAQGQPEGCADLAGRGVPAGLLNTRYAALGGRLSRLEGSGEEVRAIERLFREKHGGKALLRADAREEVAKGKEMDQYGYIHFSMHGIVTPELQAVAFSQIPGAGEDGLLTMGEMMNLRFNARLVVLSACRTGLGKVERGEGITGLTRAVIYAGSPAAVVSLWSVDDTATRELMTRFYDGMIVKGVGKSEALRAAKGEMLKTRYRHPYFWAAFVMYGE